MEELSRRSRRGAGKAELLLDSSAEEFGRELSLRPVLQKIATTAIGRIFWAV
jgi:hypothetical protein